MNMPEWHLGNMLSVTLTVGAVWLFDWRGIKDRKSKAVFAFILVSVWLMGMLVSVLPNLPGPTQILTALLRPFMRTEL